MSVHPSSKSNHRKCREFQVYFEGYCAVIFIPPEANAIFRQSEHPEVRENKAKTKFFFLLSEIKLPGLAPSDQI